MQEFIIDTEFVSTQKNKFHYLEIAMLDPETNMISDYHFDVKLNKWEQNYIKRASAGKYGKRTQEVFKSVNKLYSGEFKVNRVANICNNLDLDYYYERLEHISNVETLKQPCMLYAWDTSSDCKIDAEFDHDNLEFIDVQNIWIRRFGGNQLSLTNAYKAVLFNTNRFDEKNLIETAHFACVDVLMLKEVIEFTKTFDQKLQAIPILRAERDKKILDNNELIKNWNDKIASLKQHLEIETNELIILKIRAKIKKIEKKINHKKLTNSQLLKQVVYEEAWWIEN